MTTIHQVAVAPNPGIHSQVLSAPPLLCTLSLFTSPYIHGFYHLVPGMLIFSQTTIIVSFLRTLLIPDKSFFPKQPRSFFFFLYVCSLKFYISKQFRITGKYQEQHKNFHISIPKISQTITCYIGFINLSQIYARVTMLNIYINTYLYTILFCYLFLNII